jgi:hypothetical protein
VTDKTGGDGYLYAYYAMNSRDIWAMVSRESRTRWYITVADIASMQKLAAVCKIVVYGVKFGFSKSTLRPDWAPVLQ